MVQLSVLVPSFTVSPESDFLSSGPVGGPFSPDLATYTLVNSETIPAPFTIDVGPESWLSVTPTSGTIAAGSQTQVQVALAPGASALPSGIYTSSLAFRITNSDVDTASRQVQLTIQAEPLPLTGPVPNPFRDYTEIHFNLENPGTAYARVLDVGGHLVIDLGSKGFPAGGNKWAWGGDDGSGRRVPSGVYVFELRTGDMTQRMNVTYIH